MTEWLPHGRSREDFAAVLQRRKNNNIMVDMGLYGERGKGALRY
jgi:hypothetical protein